MAPAKVQAVTDWPTPWNLKGVRGFLEFANFYCCFIKEFVRIVQPLNDLTKKDVPWSWGQAQQEAFASSRHGSPLVWYLSCGNQILKHTWKLMHWPLPWADLSCRSKRCMVSTIQLPSVWKVYTNRNATTRSITASCLLLYKGWKTGGTTL
jgi:hypothetical protein